MLYALLLTISQYTAVKLGEVGPITFPMGLITYSASVAILDYVTLRFGKHYGYALVRVAVIAQILVALTNYLFLASQTYDVYLVSRLGGGILRRVGYSDPTAMLIDSLVFVPIAFYGIIPNNQLIQIALYQALGKIMLTPLTITAIWINRHALKYGVVNQKQVS